MQDYYNAGLNKYEARHPRSGTQVPGLRCSATYWALWPCVTCYLHYSFIIIL